MGGLWGSGYSNLRTSGMAARSDGMQVGQRGFRTAPFVEGCRCGRNLLIEVWRPAITLVFVHVLTNEAKNPGFNAPFRDQVDDSLAAGPRSEVTELMLPSSDAAVICIDSNHKSRLGASGSRTVGCDGLGVPIENPLRSGPPPPGTGSNWISRGVHPRR